jgi:hypothetical protein
MKLSTVVVDIGVVLVVGDCKFKVVLGSILVAFTKLDRDSQ